MKGKTIRIYLVDGVPTGILTAEIINWTGKVIVAPRTKLAELVSGANRPWMPREGGSGSGQQSVTAGLR